MKTSLQNTLEDIKSKEDKDSDIPASRRTRRKLQEPLMQFKLFP